MKKILANELTIETNKPAIPPPKSVKTLVKDIFKSPFYNNINLLIKKIKDKKSKGF